MANQTNRILEPRLTLTPVGFCYKCTHIYRVKLGCKAFPDGIPTNILLGKLKHDIVYPSQNGEFIFEESE